MQRYLASHGWLMCPLKQYVTALLVRSEMPAMSVYTAGAPILPLYFVLSVSVRCHRELQVGFYT